MKATTATTTTANIYNLITAEEKAKISERESSGQSQQAKRLYNELTRQAFQNSLDLEENKIEDGRGFKHTDRYTQLINFNEDIKEALKTERIAGKAEAINLYQKRSQQLKNLVTDAMEGAKIYNQNGQAKKYADFFDIPTIQKGAGTKKGYSIYSHITSTHKTVYLSITVSVHNNSIHSRYKQDTAIYSLEEDKMTIETALEFPELWKTNATKERKRVLKYLETEKKYLAILDKLKSNCDYRIFDAIKNNR